MVGRSGRVAGLRIGLSVVVLGLVAGSQVLAQAPPSWGETYVLSNGLRVILGADRRYPSVTVLVRYHVGARQEPPGRSGIAHMLEHMTFRVPQPRPRAGTYGSQFTVSSGNGATSYEHTDYYTTAPSGNLKYALWRERWRMGIVVSDLAPETREQELKIIRNERRERLEIRPYSAGRHKLWTTLFPKGHPFYDEVIGSIEDLEAIRTDDVKNYFSDWYGPNNATLTVVGDFDSAEARSIIERYYAPVRARPMPPAPAADPYVPKVETVIRHEETYGKSPRLHMAWHTPARGHAEHAVGEVAAFILGGLEANRLAAAAPGAVLAGAFQQSLRAGSVFHIIIEPGPGLSLESLQRRVDVALDVLRAHPPPPAQVEAAARRLLRGRFLEMEDSLSRALFFVESLTDAEAAAQLGPLAYEKQRFLAVTPEAVQRFVAEHLVPDRRVSLYARPAGAR